MVICTGIYWAKLQALFSPDLKFEIILRR
jgi:hypothetical protein